MATRHWVLLLLLFATPGSSGTPTRCEQIASELRTIFNSVVVEKDITPCVNDSDCLMGSWIDTRNPLEATCGKLTNRRTQQRIGAYRKHPKVIALEKEARQMVEVPSSPGALMRKCDTGGMIACSHPQGKALCVKRRCEFRVTGEPQITL
jgi:hypothetical protein